MLTSTTMPNMFGHLVGDVLQKAFGVVHANHLALVVHADVERATLCVGETADPLQVFVTPRLLVFNILLFHTTFKFRPQNYKKISKQKTVIYEHEV